MLERFPLGLAFWTLDGGVGVTLGVLVESVSTSFLMTTGAVTLALVLLVLVLLVAFFVESVVDAETFDFGCTGTGTGTVGVAAGAGGGGGGKCPAVKNVWVPVVLL